jgi:hypothetical protein
MRTTLGTKHCGSMKSSITFIPGRDPGLNSIQVPIAFTTFGKIFFPEKLSVSFIFDGLLS